MRKLLQKEIKKEKEKRKIRNIVLMQRVGSYSSKPTLFVSKYSVRPFVLTIRLFLNPIPHLIKLN